VDAATIFLTTDPSRFDVIVTDNLFGDILTDLAAAVTGGIGLAASGNINPEGTAPSMFEPVHGSAPDIAGHGVADPTAAILSAALLLDHLGHHAAAAAVDAAAVADLIADGDTRWINRGAHDLRGVAEPAREGRMPAARSLYGTLSEQLADPDAFASRLRRIIAIRNACGIATAIQIDVPDVSHRAALVLVHRLADETLQLTVLNFSGEEISGSVRSEHLPAGARVENMVTDEERGIVVDLHRFALTLAPYQGTSLRVAP
jgi:hypothetical protein